MTYYKLVIKTFFTIVVAFLTNSLSAESNLSCVNIEAKECKDPVEKTGADRRSKNNKDRLYLDSYSRAGQDGDDDGSDPDGASPDGRMPEILYGTKTYESNLKRLYLEGDLEPVQFNKIYISNKVFNNKSESDKSDQFGLQPDHNIPGNGDPGSDDTNGDDPGGASPDDWQPKIEIDSNNFREKELNMYIHRRVVPFSTTLKEYYLGGGLQYEKNVEDIDSNQISLPGLSPSESGDPDGALQEGHLPDKIFGQEPIKWY